MSGVVVVHSGGPDWFYANWLYEAVFSAIRRNLSPGLVLEKVAGATEPNMKYLDLSAWPVHHIQELLSAAQAAFAEEEAAGPSSFRDPSFFSAYLEAFTELIRLILQHPALS